MKYDLATQSWVVLRSILAVPGAARNIEDIFRAGNLLVNVIKVSRGPMSEPEMRAAASFELSPEDVTLVKQAIENGLEKGLISASEWLNEVVVKLELVKSPKAQ